MALRRMLLHRKTIKERFKIPLTYEDTVTALLTSVQVEVEYRHRTFRQSDALSGYIRSAAGWLQGNGKFGLMLLGMPGNGKTTLMRAITSLINIYEPKSPYGETVSVRPIAATELARINRDDYARFKKICDEPMLAIDDLGQEPNEVLDYGNVVTPAVDLLCHRYNEQLFTLVTTNLGKRGDRSLRSYYGDRIADRFNEMMDFIVFDNPSYRVDR